MLCDHVIEFLESPYSKLYGPEQFQAYLEFKERLVGAPRFVLERDAVHLIQNLSETTTPKRFLDALGICRLPYPKMWVEFAFADRTEWLLEAKKAGLYNPDWKDEPAAPQRMGYFLEAISDDAIRITLLWTHVDDILNFCYLGLEIEIGEHGVKIDSLSAIPDSKTVRPKNKRSWAGKWSGKADEEAAADELSRRIRFVVPPYLVPSIGVIQETMGEATLDRLAQSAVYDTAAEWRWCLSLLALLNSRNVVELGEEHTFEKLNRRRVQKGQMPLMSHRPVRISLSKVQTNRMKSDGVGTSAEMRAHMVRGHFKVRKTGVFFWSGHVRGKKAEDIKPPIYHVNK